MTHDIERANSALWSIDPSAQRGEWFKVAAAAKSAGVSFETFHEWSSSAPNYKGEQDCRTAWNSAKDGKGVGEASLFFMAQQAGWREEKTPKGNLDAKAIWDECRDAQNSHAYVQKKLGLPDGLRTYTGTLKVAGNALDGSLVVPARTLSGQIVSLQFITADNKLFLPKAKLGDDGCFVVGKIGAGDVYLCEGIGQAWAAHQATGKAAVVSFGWGRIATLAKAITKAYPNARVVIVPDGGKQSDALSIAKLVGCDYVPVPDDWERNADINDLQKTEGLDAVRSFLEQKESAPLHVFPTESGSIADFLTSEPPELHWLIPDRLLSNRAHLLTGVGGTSKTTVLYHLGIGTVVGHLPWGWTFDRTGAALLLLAEDDGGNVHRAIVKHRDNLSLKEQALIAERLRIFPMAGKQCRLLKAAANGTLEETEECRGLFNLAKSIPNLAFIGLDPALGLTEGDEMSPAHQRRLGELVDRLALETGAAVVLASHAAKAVSNADEVGTHTSRGSGAITDAVRAELVLRTMTAPEARKFGIKGIEERKAHVQLVLTKGNHAPPSAFVPVWLKRGAGGLLSLAELQEPEDDGIGVREERALDILKEMSKECAPKISEWRTACDAEGLVSGKTDSAKEKAMNRIAASLVQAGLVEKGMTKGVYVPVIGGDE